ncbi:putative metal-dependent hydrolase [Maribacter algarum]|uniref:Putative metal-dependent hydrolase n=1 Tax=Maribacter algarum (ex Zhang et al. 2020) TaxID=2578118 RepID=A0A5S3Q8H6_9FLAO|nr:putative metal-dependent hydrolase [Maribacter algarum]TMM53211.1 putative metal-dependent hydrolase [Maribacter algarum]
MEKLRYPIGQFECPKEITRSHIDDWIAVLETLPERLEALVKNLSAEQLETPYRPEGWTIRQVVHHVADSHHNSYTRFKWALTEDKPLIKAYEEKEWSKLFDARTAPIQLSLNYITALHAKLVYLLKGLSEEDLKKYYLHPEGNTIVTVAENIGKYAWHSNHHYAHIEGAVQREAWV